MNRRIRSIFWLMTICILGINAFQGYWLWTTYQLNRQQFASTVQDALFQVLEGQQIAEARQLFNTKTEKSLSYKIDNSHSRIIIHRNDSSGSKKNFIFYSPKRETELKRQSTIELDVNQKYTKKKIPSTVDTLARRISDLLVLGWAEGDHINLEKFKEAYRIELLRRNIDSKFQLDTLSIVPERTGNNVLIFDNNVNETRDNGTLQTSPLPINPVKNLFVQASFVTPTPFLLKQMGWLLGSSLFLLILTTGCFLFMLTTILKQKKLSEIKNDFINNMTHELKTPLATVTAAVEALQHFGALNDPHKTQRYLAISQNNLHRLSGLVEKVLNMAVDEKSELMLHPEQINLAGLTRELISNHQLSSLKAITFDLNIPSETTVYVDRIHFTNVLNNLIDNAINYSYDKVKICLNFQHQDVGWRLSVTDNGIGIPKVYQSAVFDRFFRVPTGDLHPVKGFGLGLAYVRQVVERHGGTISILSEPGKGSEFILDF